MHRKNLLGHFLRKTLAAGGNTQLKNQPRDLPGSPVVKTPTCHVGDTGSIPDWGTKTPQAREQLSPQQLSPESKRHSERSCTTQSSQINKNTRSREGWRMPRCRRHQYKRMAFKQIHGLAGVCVHTDRSTQQPTSNKLHTPPRWQLCPQHHTSCHVTSSLTSVTARQDDTFISSCLLINGLI